MNPSDLLREVQSHGGTIWAEGEQLELEIPDDFPDALIDTLKEHKTELLKMLTWPPPDAADLLAQWEDLGRREIPLAPGISISDLELWFYTLHGLPTWKPEEVATVRHFLLEHLPPGEAPQVDPLLEEWRQSSIPHWRDQLRDAEARGDTSAADYARYMLEVLGVGEDEMNEE